MPSAAPGRPDGALVGARLRLAVLVALSSLLGGCEVWERFTSRFAVFVALFFLAILAPLAVAGTVGLVAGLRRAPSGAATGGAWAVAVAASFFGGFAGQLLEAIFEHAPWAAVLPLLAVPSAAWALAETGRLLRARGQPSWVWWGVGAAAAAYLVWLGTMIVPQLT